MRSSIAWLTPLLLVPATALAAPHGGEPGGGGRLGQVSSGIGKAVGSDQRGNNGGRAGSSVDPLMDQYPCVDYGTYLECHGQMYDRRIIGDATYIVDRDGQVVRKVVALPPPADDPSEINVFLGIEDTYESNTAATLMASITDSRLRLSGQLTRYWENQSDGSKLTMTLPSLAAGIGSSTVSGTKVFVEAGVVYAKTNNDRMEGNSSITGGTLGLHIETPIMKEALLVGDARAMAFQHDIKAWDARIGVRSHHLEAAFRVLDFDVGPALFGPEIGLAF